MTSTKNILQNSRDSLPTLFLIRYIPSYLYTSHTSFSLAQWTLQSIYMTRIEENVLCPAAYLKREEAHPDVVI